MDWVLIGAFSAIAAMVVVGWCALWVMHQPYVPPPAEMEVEAERKKERARRSASAS